LALLLAAGAGAGSGVAVIGVVAPGAAPVGGVEMFLGAGQIADQLGQFGAVDLAVLGGDGDEHRLGFVDRLADRRLRAPGTTGDRLLRHPGLAPAV